MCARWCATKFGNGVNKHGSRHHNNGKSDCNAPDNAPDNAPTPVPINTERAILYDFSQRATRYRLRAENVQAVRRPRDVVP